MVTLGLAGVQISSWWLNVLVEISYDNVLNKLEAGTHEWLHYLNYVFPPQEIMLHIVYCLFALVVFNLFWTL